MGVDVSNAPPVCSMDRASYMRGHRGGHRRVPPRQRMSSGCGIEAEDQRQRKLKMGEREVIKSGLSSPCGLALAGRLCHGVPRRKRVGFHRGLLALEGRTGQ